MIDGPKLSREQWKLLAGAFSNISQAIILFSLAAFFVPEVVGLSKEFSRGTAVIFCFGGFIVLTFSAIIVKKGK